MRSLFSEYMIVIVISLSKQVFYLAYYIFFQKASPYKNKCTDAKDPKIKLAFFENKYTIITTEQILVITFIGNHIY